ncbi:hypothetical protein BMS3Abin03_03147 [bacterium BMS3Abin03]|nr:hypothetical protein BMS3Abin03_03147 [bacterium BMS3Abin03]
MLRININTQQGTIEKYNNLHILCQNVINALYNDENTNDNFNMDSFQVNGIINIEGDNNLTDLNCVDKKTGVYIFLNRRYNPVYIGVAGQGKKTKHSLRERLQIQLNAHNTNGTLAKNIMNIKKKICYTKKCKKKLIKNFAPNLIVISLGKSSPKNNSKAQVLEKILTAIFDPVYNK